MLWRRVVGVAAIRVRTRHALFVAQRWKSAAFWPDNKQCGLARRSARTHNSTGRSLQELCLCQVELAELRRKTGFLRLVQ